MFTHLHVHSHYSLLDGLPKIDDLVRAAKEKGFTAIALTDHGAMYGAIEFYKKCKAEGIKPIIGLEAYVAPKDLRGREGRYEEKPYHLTLLAKSFTGYRNLMKLSSIAHLEGFYYKPRIDFTTLAAHKEGLIVLSGCISGQLSKTLLAGNYEEAKKLAVQYRDTFGSDGYYVEIQRQPLKADPEFEKKRDGLNNLLTRLAGEMGIPLVATSDCHYLQTEDAEAQDILVCVETGKTVDEVERLDMRKIDLSMMDEARMKELFADLPESLEQSGKIADLVDIEIPLRQWVFPHFDIPAGYTYDQFLKEKTHQGLQKVYKKDWEQLTAENPDAIARLEYELSVISKKNFSPYFLVVADFAIWARTNGIISTTRGSAAGSLVAYTLGITPVNPLDYNLPFERFLNVERPIPPDIDTDFADSRRDEVIAYVTKKYGKDKVAQIVTFGTMMARAAVRDVGRALGVPYGKCDRIAKLIPFGRQGFPMTIEEALKISPDLKVIYNQDPETKRLIDLARKVEGVARHASIHAAGVVISPTPLTDYTPLRADTETGTITTQYDMHCAEDTGLIKMDFLGIRNLSILGNAVRLVKATKSIDIDIYNLPLDDKKTFELLAEGKTTGLFQLGGSGMTKYLKDLKPTRVEDIMAMIALYRPGPMESIPEFIRRKQNPKLISYLDPRLEEILHSSYGILTYQDDVLLIAIKIAGYTWEETDKLRKAMGKKIPREMAEQKEKFIQGCVKNRLASSKAVKLWSLIEPFAAYGFGKAHAAAYGIVAYQTAYMKANFPVEYMAAVMTAEAGNMETIAEAVNECGNLGITVLPPDVNESRDGFTVIDEKNIRFGLGAIKNLGSDVIEKIIAERKAHGPFASLSEFVSKTFVRNFNKKSWEALVKCGCLDRFGERNELLAATDVILGLARSFFKEAESKQNSLFGSTPQANFKINLKKTEPATSREKLAWEKELLGLYITSHPLDEFKDALERCEKISVMKANTKERYLTCGGIITSVKTIITKKGEQMCFAELEDPTGSIELVVFPRVFSENRELWVADKTVKINGKFTMKDEEPKILADKIEELRNDPSQETNGYLPASPGEGRVAEGQERSKVMNEIKIDQSDKLITISIPPLADPLIFRRLKEIFDRHPGDTRVALDIPSPHGPKKPVLTDSYVSESEDFKKEIDKMLKG